MSFSQLCFDELLDVHNRTRIARDRQIALRDGLRGGIGLRRHFWRSSFDLNSTSTLNAPVIVGRLLVGRQATRHDTEKVCALKMREPRRFSVPKNQQYEIE